MSGPLLDNQSYYDEFSAWYEKHRGHGYHQMLDDLEVGLVQKYGVGGDILEVGCGTGLLLQRIARFANRAEGVDLSPGMLEKAKDRGLSVQVSNATDLPFEDNTFDVVCSFKVLAHVADIHQALQEMARVTKPGGYVLAEFYNTRSVRYLVKRLKPATAISEQNSDEAVYTRYDSPKKAKEYFPANLEVIDARGIRIVTPVSYIHKIPALGAFTRKTEQWLADKPVAKNLGGFWVAIARKK